MAYNGAGTFLINSAGQPVVAGTTISETVFNALTADLATGLSTAITKNGQTAPTANLPMGGFKLTGLGTGVANTDAANVGQLLNAATFFPLGFGLAGDSIALVGGGAGYAAGDVVTVTMSGATFTTNPTISILSVSGGVVTGSMVTGIGKATLASVATGTFTQVSTTGVGSGATWTGILAPISAGVSFPSLSTGGSANNNGNLVLGGETPAAYFAGSENVFVGDRAGSTVGIGSYNTFVGMSAGGPFGGTNLAVSSSTFVGTDAGRSVASGSYQNTGVGINALRYVAGFNNTALGASAGINITTGLGNLVLGAGSAATLTTGTGNIVIGGDVSSAGITYSLNIGNLLKANGIDFPSTSQASFAGFLLAQTVSNLSANAGGGQASATQITAALNEIATVATAADSVKLPAGVKGLQITLANAAANSMQVFGQGTDTINGIAAATGIAQAGGSTYTYHCADSNKWYRQT